MLVENKPFALREGCLRVSSVQRGGIWVLLKYFGSRELIFIVEGCTTLNEIHEVVNSICDGVLGNIVL